MSKLITGALAVLSAGVCAVALAGPAAAATRTFADAKDDVAHGVDLERVKLVNEKFVRVVVHHEDLVRSFRSGAGMSVWLDTDSSKKGPEYLFGGGLFDGTDYRLTKADGWKAGGAKLPDGCTYRLRLNYADDISRIRIGRSCLGGPDEVRIAVKAAGQQKDGDTVTDWLDGRRHFTSWVAKG